MKWPPKYKWDSYFIGFILTVIATQEDYKLYTTSTDTTEKISVPLYVILSNSEGNNYTSTEG